MFLSSLTKDKKNHIDWKWGNAAKLSKGGESEGRLCSVKIAVPANAVLPIPGFPFGYSLCSGWDSKRSFRDAAGISVGYFPSKQAVQ